MHRPSRRTSRCSIYNSGEDATPAPAYSEVDERQSIGRPASPLFMQKSEANAISARIYFSERENVKTLHKRNCSRLWCIWAPDRVPWVLTGAHRCLKSCGLGRVNILSDAGTENT